MGALVTVDPSGDQASADLPWIVTIGPLGDDEDWEPVVCGPYERQHATALARAMVVDDEYMAVVEPVRPYLSVDEIRAAVALAVTTEQPVAFPGAAPVAGAPGAPDLLAPGGAVPNWIAAGGPTPAWLAGAAADGSADGGDPDAGNTVPGVDEVRAGLARIAARLATA